jgi:hypothetical protein
MIREGGSLDEGDPQEVAAAGPLAWTFGALTPSISFALTGGRRRRIPGARLGRPRRPRHPALGARNAADMMMALIAPASSAS